MVSRLRARAVYVYGRAAYGGGAPVPQRTSCLVPPRPRARAAGAWAIIAVRSAICGFLCYYGSLFLPVTIELGDLVLNTVALEFVLGVDELIFTSLAPTKVQVYVDSHKGHAVPKARHWKGLESRTVLTVGGCVGLVLYFILGVVMPQTRQLVEARDALCAGDRDFVIAEDGFGVPVWSYPVGAPCRDLRAPGVFLCESDVP